MSEMEEQNKGQLYSLLAENISDVIFTLDLKLNYTYLSPSVEKMRGFKPEELLSRPLSTVLTPSSYNLAMQTVKDELRLEKSKLAAPHRSRILELEMIKKDGSTIWTEVQVSFIRDEKLQPVGILGVTRDISARKEAEETLQNQLNFERIVARISTAFVNVMQEELDDTINRALKLSGAFFNVDRSYIFQLSADGKLLDNTHEWYAPGVEVQLGNLQNIPVAAVPWWMDKLSRYEIINIPDVGEMPPGAEAEKAGLQAQDIQSVLVVPMVTGDKLMGFLGFDSVREGKKWTEAQISLLKIVSQIISGTLARQQAEKELQEREVLQHLIMKLATEFVNVPLDHVDAGLNEMLAAIGKFTRVDRVFIFKHDYERNVTTNTHEWCAAGITPEIDNLQETPFDYFRDFLQTHQKGGIVHIPRVAAMPKNHALRLVLAQQEIQSLILLPLIHKGTNIGLVGLDAVRNVRHFTKTEVSLLKVLAELITNIVERRSSEKKLRQSEERFRALVQNAPDIMAVVDTYGNYLYTSPSFERILGYSPAEIKELNAFNLLHSADVTRAQARFMELLQKPGSTFCMELSMRHRDGSYRYFKAVGHNLLEDRAVGGIVVNAHDITEQKRAAAETDEALIQFKAVFENTEDAITLCALKQNRFIDCNNRALELFGLNSKEEFLHKHPSQFSPPRQPGGEDSEYRSRELVVQILKDGGSVNFEWLHQREDGSTFFAEVTLTKYLLSNDIILQANIRDISERKQVEQKLADYTKELEHLYEHLNEEMDKARRIHERSFSHNLPVVEGISFAAHYQPAERLGGDFYHVLRAGNKLVIYLSDVMGHGIDGAMLSLFVKEAIDSYISLKQDEIEPHKILDHLNRQYRKANYPHDYFIAIFLAVLDLDTMELQYSAAGFQDAPLVSHGNGEHTGLIVKNLPISATLPPESIDLHAAKTKLQPGMCILFNTDGLTEQVVNDKFYYQRLKDVFHANSYLPAADLVQAIITDFHRFNQGSSQGDDDITLLVLQVEGESVPEKTHMPPQ